MKSMRCVIPVILFSFIVHEGTANRPLRFILYDHCRGRLLNDVGTQEIQCHNKEGIERYIIVE